MMMRLIFHVKLSSTNTEVSMIQGFHHPAMMMRLIFHVKLLLTNTEVLVIQGFYQKVFIIQGFQELKCLKRHS